MGPEQNQHQEVAQRSAVQRLSDQTNGVINPVSLLSIVGAGLTIGGARLIQKGHEIFGSAVMGLGRTFDMGDGAAARKFDLTSEFGKRLDPMLDKVQVAIAGPILLKSGILPWPVAAAFAAQNGANAFLAIEEEIETKNAERSVMGARAHFFQWTGATLYGFSAGLSKNPKHESKANKVRAAAHVSSALGIGLGYLATKGYAQKAKERDGLRRFVR